jgi:hypothetical protein
VKRSSELADWIAGVDLADPLIRHFVSDFRTLEATWCIGW